MALAAYRQLLRSTHIAFQGEYAPIHSLALLTSPPGDLRVLSAARYTARSNFNTNRSLPPGSPEAEAARAHAEEVAVILRKNIVQGEQVEGSEDKYRGF